MSANDPAEPMIPAQPQRSLADVAKRFGYKPVDDHPAATDDSEGYAPNRCEIHKIKYFSVCPECASMISVEPATDEQEWTVEQQGTQNIYLIACNGKSVSPLCTHYSLLRQITDAHNAALVAEQKETEKYRALAAERWNQLTAEREERQRSDRFREKLRAKYRLLEEQFLSEWMWSLVGYIDERPWCAIMFNGEVVSECWQDDVIKLCAAHNAELAAIKEQLLAAK